MSGLVVSSGDTEEVLSGTTVVAATVYGALVVDGGGLADNTIVYDGGSVSIASGGHADGLMINNGGFAFVNADGSVTGAVVGNGGFAYVAAGGTASGTIISAGASEYVEAGGHASGTIVGSGGAIGLTLADISTNGTIDGVTIQTGGILNLDVVAGGVASGTVISGDGSYEYVASGGVVDNTVAGSSGQIYVDAGGVAHGVTLSQGGSLELAGNTDTVTFGAGGGSLILDPTGAVTGALNNFSVADDSIVFTGQTVTAAAVAGSNLAVTLGSGQTLDFTLTGTPVASGPLLLSPDGSTIFAVTCFMPGTLVATPMGERAVEDLAIGDSVLTHEGDTAPILWIGRQTVSTGFADPLRVLPIRVQAGALSDGVPTHDLLVSPDHALLIDGILIQAGALVNGTTITRETDVPEIFTYYHIELADHALILAEGVPAETFVNNTDRMGFDNWAEHLALFPEGRTIGELSFPRAKSYRQVPRAMQQKLAMRAQYFGGSGTSAVA